MLHFIYAFDYNYNQQGFTSIYSLLQNVDEKINISLLLDSSSFNVEVPLKIDNHKKLNILNKYLINSNEQFYNLDDSHVSKATFYRLLISEKLRISSDYLIYLDCDVVCLQNPVSSLHDVVKNMEINRLSFAMVDELYRFQSEEAFIRLFMDSDKYFNAGFMVIDLKYWTSNSLTIKSINKIKELKNKAKFWDQDILNSLVDGNYMSLDNRYNFKSTDFKLISNKALFVHFSGKTKPWEVGGVYENFADIYHNYYSSLFSREFHITCKNRKNSLQRLLKTIFFKKVTFRSIKYIFKSLYVIIKKF